MFGDDVSDDGGIILLENLSHILPVPRDNNR